MAELSDIFRGISSGRFPGRELNERSPGISPFLNRFPEEVLNRRGPSIPPFLNRFNATQSIEEPDAAKTMPNAVQRQDGMGLNNIAGRQGSFPLTAPPFGASGTLDTALPGMGYDYSNEGYTDFTPMGHDYSNEGYAGPWAPSYADEYAGERSPLNAVSQADWSTPQRAVSSGPTFEEKDMLANAGENRDLPVDPREIAIKKRFGQNIGNLWGDARLRERMQDLYGGSL